MRSKVLLAITTAAVAFVLFGCSQSERGLIRSIEQSANKAVTTTNPTVTISAMTDFAWDKLFVFGPYTSVQKINTDFGFEWNDAAKTRIDMSDTIYLLVFTKDKKVVFYAEVPRGVGDFKGLETQNQFVYGQDQFHVVATNIDNRRRIIFCPAQSTNRSNVGN